MGTGHEPGGGVNMRSSENMDGMGGSLRVAQVVLGIILFHVVLGFWAWLWLPPPP
jgi:hypothetical protein